MTTPSGRPFHRQQLVIELLVALLLVVTFLIGPMKLLGIGWLSYLLPDALAGGILVLLFAGRALRGQPLFAASALSIPLLVLALLCFLELANPESPFVRSVIGLRTWLLQFTFYFVGFYLFRSPRQIEHLYALLLTLGIATAVYGIYQWRVGPQAFASWSEAYGRYGQIMWSTGTFRAFSTFVVPNVFGANMGLLMLVAFGIAASSYVRARWRLVAGSAFAVMGAGIAASGTRAPVVQLGLAFLLGVVALAPVRRQVKIAVFWVLLGASAVLLVLSTIGTRVAPRFLSMLEPEQYLWKWLDPLVGGISTAIAHPFGMGMGYTGGIPQFVGSPALANLPSTIVDSGYGSAAAEMGFLGLAVLVYLFAKVAIEGVRNWRALAPGRLKDLMLGPALVAVIYPVIGLVGGTHTSYPGSVYSWIFVGMLFRAPALWRTLDADHVSAAALHTR